MAQLSLTTRNIIKEEKVGFSIDVLAEYAYVVSMTFQLLCLNGRISRGVNPKPVPSYWSKSGTVSGYPR
jgi:hypothetical protein